MAAQLRVLRLLLQEIEDKYVQENFYKLKLYLEALDSVVGDINTTIINNATPSVALTSPRLVQQFNTDVGTNVGDLVRVNAANTVTKILTNDSAEIPNGMFGVGYFKPSPLLLDVMFVGIGSSYAGLTTGQAVFISTGGVPTHTITTTGMLQQIGFAISATEIFFLLQQPIRRT